MKDFVNKKIGKLLIKNQIKKYREEKKGPNGKIYTYDHPIYLAVCDCGKEVEVKQKYLTKKNPVQSCGCIRRKDLTGLKFGKGTVIKYHGQKDRGDKSKRTCVQWELKCDCGNTYLAVSEHLLSYQVCSCGCYKLEQKTPLKSHYKKNWNIYFKNLKANATKRKLDFDITIEFIKELLKKQKNKCALSGIDIDLTETGSASLDRINNDCGYKTNNIQWVHRDINYMKNQLNQNDFISLCKKVNDYNP